ncbi:MAG: GNAT family N-acetyltransferase [Candidatus Micrarchaeota archaeon]|nr:GNAT family N-acetyltransferase [Candidatus Micrarchaeota archaeon]
MRRQATLKDAYDVAKMLHEYDLYEHRLDKRIDVTPLTQYKRDVLRYIRTKSLKFLIIFEDSKPVGFVDYRIDGKEGVMNDVFIREGYRGKGLGAKLANKIFTEMKRHGCKVVKSGVRVKNVRSQKFWQRQGFKIQHAQLNYGMRKSL